MLTDSYGRRITYLRLSVTERCNFRCRYCMPEKPFSWVPHENVLTYEEMFAFVKAAVDLGIEKIRLTGGEPTLRKGLEEFIGMIASYAPHVDLAMTTNGYLLANNAAAYAAAGLRRINISLDSLDAAVAASIAQKEVLPQILAGIEAAKEAGMKVKINMVPLRGINDHEMIDILEFGRSQGMEVRYIEYMENALAGIHNGGLRAADILARLSEVYDFTDEGLDHGSPSHRYRMADGYRFGIIEPHKEDFCGTCNRIRLTAEGHLIPCLYFDEAMSIREALRRGDVTAAVEIFKSVIAAKPEKNRWGAEESSTRAFYQTGG